MNKQSLVIIGKYPHVFIHSLIDRHLNRHIRTKQVSGKLYVYYSHMDKLLKRMNRRGATVSVSNRAHAHQKMINVREATVLHLCSFHIDAMHLLIRNHF